MIAKPHLNIWREGDQVHILKWLKVCMPNWDFNFYLMRNLIFINIKMLCFKIVVHTGMKVASIAEKKKYCLCMSTVGKIHLKLSSNVCFRYWLSRPGWTSHSTEANKHSKAISRWTSDYQGNAILSSTGSQYMFYSKHVLVFLSPPKYIYFLLVSCWL